MRARSKLGDVHLSAEQLVALVIILVVTALSIWLILDFRKAIAGQASDCAAAVQQNAAANNFARGLAKDIKGCPTNDVTIKRTDLSSDNAQAVNDSEHILAEEMRKCWQDWGAGKLNLFNGEGTYCHVCSSIAFEREVHDQLPLLHNFDTYLQATKAPTGQLYSELLSGYVSANAGVPTNLGIGTYTVDTSKPYVVVFWYTKTKAASSLLEQGLGVDITPTATAAIVAVPVAAGVLFLSGGSALLNAGGAGVLSGGLTFLSASVQDQFRVLAATYLIPETPGKLQAYDCQQAASVSVSP